MVFFFGPCRTLCTALVALFFSGLWLAIAIKHRDPHYGLVAAAIVAASIFMIFHSAKWCIRMWREWLK